MGWPLAMAVFLILAVVVGAFLVWGTGMFKSAESGAVAPGDVEAGRAVRYEVPRGQDPAVVLVALEHEGVDARPDPDHPGQAVLISCEGADTRERARTAIERAWSTSLDDPPALDPRPVRFSDEH